LSHLKNITVTILAVFSLGLSANESLATENKLLETSLNQGRIVFTKNYNNQKDIYVLDFQTGLFSPLVATPSVDEYPTWSPDGSRVTFYSDMCGDREIYSIKDDGTELKRLTKSPGIDEDPDWSPDGRQIVFRSERAGKGQSGIYTMNADGSSVRRIALGIRQVSGGTGSSSTIENSVPRWSPRGNEILYSTDAFPRGWDIMLADMTLKKKFKLTDGYKSYFRASWHPSGGSFAFSFGSEGKVDIWEYSKTASEPKRLTKGPGKEYDPVFNDDGTQMFFTAELTKGRKDFQIFLLDLETREISRLTSGDAAIRHISWTSLPFVPLAKEDSSEEQAETTNNADPVLDQGLDLKFIEENICAI